MQNHPILADTNGPMQTEGIPFVSAPIPDLTFDEARVLVCTTFVGDTSPDMAYYDQWLERTPLLASNIAMEGMFLGPPTMLLVSMPSSAWNVVQHDKVCCFLGYINSHNMVDLYKGFVKSTTIPRGLPAPVGPPNSSFMGGPVGSAMPFHPRAGEDGRMLFEASQITTNSPIIKTRHESIAQQVSAYSQHANRHAAPARKTSASLCSPDKPHGRSFEGQWRRICRDEGSSWTAQSAESRSPCE